VFVKLAVYWITETTKQPSYSVFGRYLSLEAKFCNYGGELLTKSVVQIKNKFWVFKQRTMIVFYDNLQLSPQSITSCH